MKINFVALNTDLKSTFRQYRLFQSALTDNTIYQITRYCWDFILHYNKVQLEKKGTQT